MRLLQLLISGIMISFSLQSSETRFLVSFRKACDSTLGYFIPSFCNWIIEDVNEGIRVSPCFEQPVNRCSCIEILYANDTLPYQMKFNEKDV
jgi:hypothetical protein